MMNKIFAVFETIWRLGESILKNIIRNDIKFDNISNSFLSSNWDSLEDEIAVSLESVLTIRGRHQ